MLFLLLLTVFAEPLSSYDIDCVVAAFAVVVVVVFVDDVVVVVCCFCCVVVGAIVDVGVFVGGFVGAVVIGDAVGGGKAVSCSLLELLPPTFTSAATTAGSTPAAENTPDKLDDGTNNES